MPTLREWSDLTSAPGDDVVRLRSVRIRDEYGATSPTIDIRCPVGVEIVFDVFKPNYILVPGVTFFNDSRQHIFDVMEVKSEWRGKPRPNGRYVSTAWIPGNFLSEGSFVLNVSISTHVPLVAVHIAQRDVVAFRVLDRLQGDSARGDYTGPWTGMVRPLVDWTSEFHNFKALERETVETRPSL